ncbi:MAG: response regulator [Anaerolineales bacterium]|nr:response regulator [Anaerolineales bacterium]
MRYAFVIDDNRMIANNLVKMLGLLGYEAYAAYGPLPAMQALSQHVPDVIVLDIHMQGVNGVDLCGAIRRDPRLRRVPILAISSDTQPDLIASMRAAGANGFLAKPILIDDLEQALLDAQRDAAASPP